MLMTGWNPVEVSRNCPATTLPYGDQVTLDAGGLVEVVQRLGASIMVRTEMGSLLQIDGAGAVGLEPVDVDEVPATGPFEIGHVIDALQSIYDPEIPVSIVELGLVYRCDEIQRRSGRDASRSTCR
jgi:hypothetical protein